VPRNRRSRFAYPSDSGPNTTLDEGGGGLRRPASNRFQRPGSTAISDRPGAKIVRLRSHAAVEQAVAAWLPSVI
jgi:hypothetical protein